MEIDLGVIDLDVLRGMMYSISLAIIIILLFLLLIIPSADAQPFQTNVTYVAANGSVTITHEAGTQSFSTADQSSNFSINLQRECTNTELEQLFAQNLNMTRLTTMVSEEVDQSRADLQAYFQQTVIPETQRFINLESELEFQKKSVEDCKNLVVDQSRALSFYNSTRTEHVANLERENQVMEYIVLGFVALLSLTLILKIKERKGGRLFL